jgi:hypothetical protein
MQALALAAVLAALVPCALPSPARALEVEASLETATVGIEDTVRYTVTISDERTLSNLSAPKLGRMTAFEVLGHPSIQQRVEMTSFRGTRFLTAFTWQLQPLELGDHVIPAAALRYQGKDYESNPVRVQVVEGSRRAGQRRRPRAADPFTRGRTEPIARLRPVLSRQRAVVGEGIVLTYRLVTNASLISVEPVRAPEFPGFLVREQEMEVSARQIEVEGERMLEYDLARYILFPLEPGEARIPSVQFVLSARVPDDFFRFSLFDRTETLRAAAPSRTVHVDPLPAGVPAGFAGAVGRFDLEASLSGNRTLAGEAVTLRLALSGRGNFPSLGSPTLPEMPGLRTFEPQVGEELRVLEDGMRGTRTWEYVLVPLEAGTVKVPRIAYAYFDPSSDRYRTTLTRPLELEVAPAPVQAGGVEVTGSSLPTGREDLNYLKGLPAGGLTRAHGPLYRSVWFGGLVALPPLAYGALWAAAALARRRGARAGAVRSRRAAKRARSRLGEARRLLSGPQARPFLEAVSDALLGFVADRGELDAATLTAGEAVMFLAERGVPDEICEGLRDLLERCDRGRFAPVPVPPSERRKLWGEARALLRKVERSTAASRARRGAAAVLLVWIAAGWGGGPRAESVPASSWDAVFEQASEAYRNGEFERAAGLFQGLADSGVRDGAVHYNLASAEFRRGRLGEAVLHYRRALRAMPGDRETVQNLAFVESFVSPDARTRGGVSAGVDAWVPPGVSGWGVVVLWWGLFLGMAAAAWARGDGLRKAGAYLAGFAFAAWLPLAAILAWQAWRIEVVRQAVVLAPQVTVRSGPGREFTELHALPEGATARLREERDGWLRVALPKGRSGWVPEGKMGKI